MKHTQIKRGLFEHTILMLVCAGKYPSGRTINRYLRRNGSYMSGTEREWRRELLTRLESVGMQLPKREGFKT